MAPKLKPGDRVVIETLSQEAYEGNVSSICSSHINICEVYIRATDTHYPGSLTFYRDEVHSVNQISDISSQDSASLNGSTNGKDAEISKNIKKIKLHPDEYDRLKEMAIQFTFIDVFGKKFTDAVEVLSNRESVAVAGLGSTFQRGKALSLLIMSDFKQVYIFDMVGLIQLRGLKTILEAGYITKVVHGGEALFDCLYHRYEVEMINVFDTQVVDSVMSKTDNNAEVVRNLSQSLCHHFNFPPALLDSVMEDMDDKKWEDRPVTKTDKLKAAHLVVYLLTLRDHLMKIILKGYTNATLQKYNPYKHLSDIELLTQQMNQNRVKN